jgi:hypothetical protein
MTIYKKILLGIIALNFLNACQKNLKKSSGEDLQNVISKLSASETTTTDPEENFVAITCMQTANWGDTGNSYDIVATAMFTNDAGVHINTGPVVINGRTIEAGPDNTYEYSYTANNLAEGKSLLGSSVQISATGVGGTAARLASSSTIIVPKAIFPSTFYYPNSTLDKAVALPITWAPDPNNQYQQVFIELYYYQGISQSLQPGMPNSIPHLWYQAADNGSFTIPQADLNAFPKGCYVGISITRASYINSDGNFVYIAVTAGHSLPVLVTDSRNPIYGDVWTATSTAGVSGYGYYSGDVNGDGNTDIIQPWSNGGTLAIIAHDISGPSTNLICNNTMNGIGTGNVGFLAADFDGDGKSDFVQGWNNGNHLAFNVFKSNSTSFSYYSTFTMPLGSGSLRLLPVDMDGDGKTDIAQLWNNNGKMGLNIYKSTGTSYIYSYSTTFNEGSGNIGVFPADYNGDGKTDIVELWSNNGSLAEIVYKSTGSSYVDAGGGTFSEGSGNVGFAPVDYNADGKFDFIQGWSNNGKMSILLYKSNGSSYIDFNNSNTQQGSPNIGLVPVRRAGLGKTGFVQVWNNNNKTAFIRYWPVN